MRFTVITLFPEILDALNFGIVGKALEQRLINVACINPRDYADDKHKTVDDAAYGGGPGMVMMAKPLHQAIIAAKSQCYSASKVIYLSPQGKPFNQIMAKNAAQQNHLIMIAGRYEGIDQRIIDKYVDEEWSLGDYVVSGGEFAALVVIDAIARCVPEVVGNADSVSEDSFYSGLLKHPQYTRPENYDGQEVPKVLLSGDHRAVSRWRKKHSLGNTWLKRSDLLKKLSLTKQEQQLLNEFIEEYRKHEETTL